MRKAIMGLGGGLVVVGLVMLIMSVILIGGIKGQVKGIDLVVDEATGALTEVGGLLDGVGRGIGDLDATLAEVEEPIGDMTEGVEEWFEAGDIEVTASNLDGIAAMVETAGLDATWLRDEADRLRAEGQAWSVTADDVTEVLAPIAGGISEARGFLKTAQTDLGGFGDDLGAMAAGIEAMDIGGMISGAIGGLQTFMIINSILFMAAGAGLFLVGKRTEA